MNSAEKEAVLHCLKSMIDEEVCEECPLYGTTGTDHCEKDCVRLAINALEQVPCTDAISRQAVLMEIDKYLCGVPFEEKGIDEVIKDLPPVKPQYTDAEIQKMQDLESAEIQKAYEIGKDEGSEVLDKIRAEIDSYCSDNRDRNDGLYIAMRIIDKYKASPTGAERSDKE